MKFDWLASIFFPPRCVRCEQRLAKGALCPSCADRIPVFPALRCGACRQALPAWQLFARSSPCHPSFPHLLGAATSYDHPSVQALVRALKFSGIRNAALPLGTLLADYAGRMRLDPARFAIIPIPLSKRRERARGFNQSELIARRFADAAVPSGARVERGLLIRTRHTKPQTETKDVAERKANILGCFSVPDPAKVRGRDLLLIDDVVTSGATFLEAARMLNAAGAASVFALAVASA